jgi:hypothetical protein
MAVLAACVACTPALTRDGQLVFTPGADKGGSILTANGVEYVDRTYVPKPKVRTSAFEPWSPAGGFLLPADGVWKRISRPLRIALPRLRLVARTSDGLVPSWGGELLVRLDAAVPSDARSRQPVAFGLVMADRAGAGTPLAHAALEALGTDDLVGIVDADGSRVVLPAVPCTHRTLASAALERRVGRHRPTARRDLAWAMHQAVALLAEHTRVVPRLLVIADAQPIDGSVDLELAALDRAGVNVVAVAANEQVAHSGRGPFAARLVTGDDQARLAAIWAAIPEPREAVIDDIQVSFTSVPAPAHIVEASGGDVESDLETDRMRWPAMRPGEARTEVVRLSLPVWTPGEPFELDLSASYRELGTGRTRYERGRFVMRFSDDVYLLGEERYGDVLAYASALAMVHRLGRTFLGSRADSVDGFRGLVEWQAHSMFDLSRRFRDPAMLSQGLVLEALLQALYG